MKKEKSSPILYREIKPAESLCDYIFCYWQFEYFPDDQSQVLDHSIFPDGCTSFVFIKNPNLPSVHIRFTGPRTGLFRLQISPNSIYIGLRFLPQAFEPLFGLSPQEIRGKTIPAYPYFQSFNCSNIIQNISRGFSNFSQLDQLFQQYITQKQPVVDQPISQAIQLALNKKGQIKVTDLAAVAHLSIRQFQRRFKYVTGLTPKEFLKIRRLRSSAKKLLLEGEDYQEVLLQGGYFDQAHFIHDFSMVAGTNPTLFGRYISQIKHIDVG